MRKIENQAVLDAIRIIGGYEKTAKLLKLSRVNLSYWIRGAQLIPLHHAKILEKATKGKITEKDLCPSVKARKVLSTVGHTGLA